MSLITDRQAAQYHDLGYFVTDPMFSPAELLAVSDEFDRLHGLAIDEARASGDPKTLELTTHRPFIGQAHTRSALLAELVRAPIYLDAAARFVGPDADLYYNQAVIKPPGTGRSFAWHQDSGYHVTRPLEYVTCWTAISRTFLANGCIWVIPASHRWGLLDHPFDEETRERRAAVPSEAGAIPVEMEPGQVAIFSSLLLHKSGPNTSGRIRRGYVPQYHHAGLVEVATGKPWGDQYPVLRGGRKVTSSPPGSP
jgi:phytanoyl-CoA hydroxylase